jgi:hypothetical protein
VARGKSRRGLLAQTGSYVKNVAGNVAEKNHFRQAWHQES